ncbi:MAG: NAD-dependent epimerase/dehydratase family protein [Candidatus Heimdallarchaeota archaeon]|nr:MAG: NAD-dependent epimerase/dehydratase family protein [Candidatus Heimdallarchaeota archaeon]
MTIVAITGISGYLGTQLHSYLDQNAGIEKILGLDIVKPPDSPKLQFHKIDIRNPEITSILKQSKVDVVIHLAFICKELRNRKEMWSIDIEGTQNILKAIEKVPTVSHLLTLSSVSAYGAHPDNPTPLTEDTPLRGSENKFQYARDKAEMDLIIQDFMKNHPEIIVTMFRPTFVMGPNVDNFFSFYLEKFPIVPISRQTKGRFQLIHEDDMTRLIIQAIEEKIPGIFNVAAPKTVTYIDLLKLGKKRFIKMPNFLVYPAANILWWLGIAGASAHQIDFIRFSYIEDISFLVNKFNFKFKYDTIETFVDFWKGKGRRINEEYLAELKEWNSSD